MNNEEHYIPSSKKIVYSHIADKITITKAELLANTGLTSTTLTRLLDEMMEEGLIQIAELGPSRGGRRPILYKINADYRYIFGIEISRIHSSIGLFDMQLNAKSFIQWRMDEAMTPTRFLKYALQQMRLFLRDHHISHEQVMGVGIGAVGPLDRDSGMILDPVYFSASGWSNVPICALLSDETGWVTAIENGANAALLGEQWVLRNELIQHALYLHAGVSLRSAMMSHGRIIHGTVDMEGAIGQMIIQTDGSRLNHTGNYGSLEAYASIESLEKQARTQAKMGRFPFAHQLEVAPERINFEFLRQAQKSGDPFAQELFKQSATYLGVGVANIINMFHPDQIILGGALINSSPLYYDTVIEVALKNTYYHPKYQPHFSKGQLKEAAVATGAALSVWKNIPF
ncbi:putative NBD/HSP70 family sugar kinase [Paenibacillus shirakamiensis]|uniref:NBD/HSP70 family sugar kinase n=1 Tax=Paenibacillus shirakamiensis TaxID=1265935 RepID=A0ABS4JEF9_9BACL|nr:ROK family protein [Paenibacillus shirakamiensis]MBP2000083.1 putative NBD/HSP70 family sugar kinase [Paenibacillus shirakamiensis]